MDVYITVSSKFSKTWNMLQDLLFADKEKLKSFLLRVRLVNY